MHTIFDTLIHNSHSHVVTVGFVCQVHMYGTGVGVKKVNICDCNYIIITNCITLWLLQITAVL